MNIRQKRINELKERTLQTNLIKTYFASVNPSSIIFIDKNSAKDLLSKSFNVAYSNIYKKFCIIDLEPSVDDVFYAALSEYLNLVEAIEAQIAEIQMNIFFWREEAYCLRANGKILVESIKLIAIDTNFNDLLFISNEVEIGICLLRDEHYFSISKWGVIV